jgi:DNA-binding MarR family transcriptional regulator
LARRVSEADRRAHVLHVTPAGGETIARIGPAVEAAQRTMLQGLTAAEAARFMRLLRKAVDGANALSRAPMAGEGRPPSRPRPSRRTP